MDNMSRLQLQQNRLNGKLAQIYSQQDFVSNGFSVVFAGDHGFDFIAVKVSAGIIYMVEVKYNRSKLSKLQKMFRNYCRKSSMDYFVYRVTKAQLKFWLAADGMT